MWRLGAGRLSEFSAAYFPGKVLTHAIWLCRRSLRSRAVYINSPMWASYQIPRTSTRCLWSVELLLIPTVTIPSLYISKDPIFLFKKYAQHLFNFILSFLFVKENVNFEWDKTSYYNCSTYLIQMMIKLLPETFNYFNNVRN